MHDYVHLPIELNDLLDHPSVQRLRGVGQTAMSSTVFPSMKGSRFEHSLGAMHLAQVAWEGLWGRTSPGTKRAFTDDVYADLKNRPKLIDKVRDTCTQSWVKDSGVFRDDFEHHISLALAAAALLHDLGHPPFSHALEGFFERHLHLVISNQHGMLIQEASEFTQPQRMAFHERVGRSLLDQIEPSRRKDIPWYVVKLIIDPGDVEWAKALHEIISSDVDVDRLDYIARDAGRAGTEFGSIDRQRLIDSLELHRPDVGRKWAVGLGVRARTAIETLLTNRLRYYQWVLFHPHVAAANKFLDLALEELIEIGSIYRRQPADRNDMVLSQAFDRLRPNLNYLSEVQVSHVLEDRQFIDSSARQLRGEVDDATVVAWLKASASLARATSDYVVSSHLRARLDRFLALYDATQSRVPNWAPAWKTEDQYAEIAAALQPALLETLRKLVTESVNRTSATLEREQSFDGQPAESAGSTPVAKAIGELVRVVNDDPLRGLNEVARHLLHSSEPRRRLEGELSLARAMKASAPLGGSLEGGFWVLVYDRVKAMGPADSGVSVWRYNASLPLRQVSAMVDALPDIADSYPQVFAYYVVPHTDNMRVNRFSPHSGELREAFIQGFPAVAEALLRDRLGL